MGIGINGRQLEVTSTIREWLNDRLGALSQDQVLKTTQINVMLEREKNRFKTSLVLNCTFHVLSAETDGFDLGKTAEEAIQKLEAQAQALRDKIRSHQAEGLAQNEARKAETQSSEE